MIQQQTDPFAFPSIMPGVPFETYLEIEAASSSAIKIALAESMLHVREKVKKETEAMRRGTLVHEMLLEPDAKRYVVLPEGSGRGSNKARELYVEALADALDMVPPAVGKAAPSVMLDGQIRILQDEAKERGLYIVDQATHAQAVAMRDAALSHPIASIILEDFEPELTVLARHEETGCPVKTRADIWSHKMDLTGDIKTTDSAGYDAYTRKCGTFQYHVQAALYEWAARANGSPRAFRHIVIESEPPHGVRVIGFDQEAVAHGWQRCLAAFPRFAEAYVTGYWPGYPEEIESISLPRWAL
jgi:hypothetical protein